MFSKNLKFYRLKKSLSKKELAALIGVAPMTITHYEQDTRRPDTETLRKLANALDVKVSDFLAIRNENLIYQHGEFRKQSSLSKQDQEFITESVEEYLSRFMLTVEILSGEVIPKAPACKSIEITKNVGTDALNLRKHLKFSESGPIDDLIGQLENKGFLIIPLNIENDKFSGMNGFVNEIPYIVINDNMTTERKRSTLVHELAHLMFIWDDFDDDEEKYANSISGSFLLPDDDLKREIGIKRSSVCKDMILVAKEYGVSMGLLVKRANQSKIINERVYKSFWISAGQMGWRKNEPSRISPEKPLLFEQLVYRAVNENEISIQKGAELLKEPYDFVKKSCMPFEV